MNIDVKYPAVTASFTVNITSGTAPLSVQFTDSSTNNPVSWYWNLAMEQPAQNKTQHTHTPHPEPTGY